MGDTRENTQKRARASLLDKFKTEWCTGGITVVPADARVATQQAWPDDLLLLHAQVCLLQLVKKSVQRSSRAYFHILGACGLAAFDHPLLLAATFLQSTDVRRTADDTCIKPIEVLHSRKLSLALGKMLQQGPSQSSAQLQNTLKVCGPYKVAVSDF